MTEHSPTGVAVSLGSMPGLSVTEALNIVAGETPDIVALPELPLRGPGADMIGRAFALLHQVDRVFAVETTPSGWRLAGGEPRDTRRATSWLGEDLDALEALAAAESGWIKTQLCGPLTVAAAVEPLAGERLIADGGARRALTQGLAEAAALHIAELRRRLPRARFVVQVDEPGLTAALQGAIPSRSGRSRLPQVSAEAVIEALATLTRAISAAGAEPWLHSCADDPNWSVFAKSGAVGWSVPARFVFPRTADQVAAHLDTGGRLVLGYDADAPGWQESSVVAGALRLARGLGVGDDRAAECLLLSHTCGLALSDAPVTALRRLATAARGVRGDGRREELDESRA